MVDVVVLLLLLLLLLMLFSLMLTFDRGGVKEDRVCYSRTVSFIRYTRPNSV